MSLDAARLPLRRYLTTYHLQVRDIRTFTNLCMHSKRHGSAGLFSLEICLREIHAEKYDSDSRQIQYTRIVDVENEQQKGSQRYHWKALATIIFFFVLPFIWVGCLSSAQQAHHGSSLPYDCQVKPWCYNVKLVFDKQEVVLWMPSGTYFSVG